ncbi:MAG TPA: glycosyltransferase, partial [Chitinophagaceae bacterium]|nr:glycosyltransferase [Chitinophagaceae bacterium]
YYVSISNADRDPSLKYTATVYNGIDTSAFTFCAKPKDYLLFFGRIHPEKGTLAAIQVAKQCGKKLLLAGLVQDTRYFETYIKPQLDNEHVIYLGNCGPEQRDELLGNARALLHLVNFDEPFGLSVAEAMCCGTPVIAFKRGAMPELIENAKTGFIVNTKEEAAASIEKLPGIDRSYCSQRAIRLFSGERMADDYIQVYNHILQQKIR